MILWLKYQGPTYKVSNQLVTIDPVSYTHLNINVMFDNLIKQTKDDIDNITRNTGKCSGLSLIHI